MKKYLLLFSILISVGTKAQYLNKNIVEVFWNKDTMPTFNYTLTVISGNDTVQPTIKNQYFFGTLPLEKMVTLMLECKNKKVVVANVERDYLKDYAVWKFRVNPAAKEDCVERIMMKDNYITNENSSCSENHFAVILHGYDSYSWVMKKIDNGENRHSWWKSIEAGNVPEFEK